MLKEDLDLTVDEAPATSTVYRLEMLLKFVDCMLDGDGHIQRRSITTVLSLPAMITVGDEFVDVGKDLFGIKVSSRPLLSLARERSDRSANKHCTTSFKGQWPIRGNAVTNAERSDE